MPADNTQDVLEASSHLSSDPTRNENDEIHSSLSERAFSVEMEEDDTVHEVQGAPHLAMASTEHSLREHEMQLSEIHSVLDRLQADNIRLAELFEAMQRPPSISLRSFYPPNIHSASSPHLRDLKWRKLYRIEPQFWQKFQVVDRSTRKVSLVDVLVGDQDYSLAGKAPEKRAGLSFTEHAIGQKDNLNAPIDAAAMKELEEMRDRYMPEQIRINSFLLQYLLRTIFGAKAEITHNPSPVGLLLFNPFKSILKNSNMLTEKLEAFVKLIEIHESKTRTEEGDLSRDAEIDPTIDSSREIRFPQSFISSRSQSIANSLPLRAEAVEPVVLTIAAIEGIMEKLDIQCCAECYHSLLEELDTTEEAKDTINCFLGFVHEHLIPVHEKFRKRIATQVTFNQLWHVFQPGDHLVTNVDPDVDYQDSFNLYSSLWKILRVEGGRRMICNSSSTALPPVRPPPLMQTRQPPPPPFPVNSILPFTIDTYVLDYDGVTIVPVRRRFFISPFIGERRVADLEVFPFEYASERLSSKDVLIRRGKKFFEYVTSGRTGCHVDVQGSNLRHMQEIFDEQMIIDPTTYWEDPAHVDRAIYSQPEMLFCRETKHYCLPETAGPMCQRDHLFYAVPTVADEYVDQDSMDSLTKNQYLFGDYNERRLKDKIEMTDDDFAICTHQVPGWLLRSRRFAWVHIDSVKRVRRLRAGLPFNQLVLPPETKAMVQSQVQEHFRKKKKHETRNQTPGLDIVGGKGLGLTILIHGAPGVGKTATAECVADLVGKSLYPLTCGDLGNTAQDIENNLSFHLYSATRWDCILLLDEADVFMAKRTKEDYVRNAAVSVFLRLLEYYKGVLILTTNRIGTFDEAFKSRIHLSLFYPNFDEDDTVAVFKVFIERTKLAYPKLVVDAEGIEAFARKHYNSVSEDSRWNGRQIRNAFHTAVAMAEYDARTKVAGLDPNDPVSYGKDCEVTVKLGKAHFKAVAKTVRLFDEYLEETLGVTYQQRIENEKIRKKGTHARAIKIEHKDEVKELRRELEALKKLRAKKIISDGDDSENSEIEKAKKKKKKAKEKEKLRAGKKAVRFEASSSDSEESEESEDEKVKTKKRKAKEKELVVMAKKADAYISDSSS